MAGRFCVQKMLHQHCWLSSRQLYICTKCEHQHSLTAGTIMANSQKPITYWFKAMWWFTTRKSGINAVNLKELLGFGSYATAWSWLQKLRRCAIRQNREKRYGAHLVTTLVKRLIRSTYQGRFEPKYLQNYLDENVFRFNRRKSLNIGKKFMRIVQQALKSSPVNWGKIQGDLDPISKLIAVTGAS
jgi:hypothetical protein